LTNHDIRVKITKQDNSFYLAFVVEQGEYEELFAGILPHYNATYRSKDYVS